MCGIVAIHSSRSSSPELLTAAIQSLNHRGPDHAGMWTSEDRTVSLGHSRLSIVDITSGAQPIANEANDVIIVVNGEFYGYQNIRRDLQQKGHHFKTNSDSELLVHLYEAYGVGCLHLLRGEFAFVLWDKKQQRLFAARDRFGIKPLCYTRTADSLIIASEAKAILATGISAAWDEYSFFHAANLQYTPAGSTLFKDIAQLQPGHYLLYKNGNLDIQKYWDLDYPIDTGTITVHEEKETIAQFEMLLRESVQLRLQADVPICCHLSGGIDSSTVLAMASQLSTAPMHCFTVSFDDEAYDELASAQEMAHHAGAVLHQVRVTQQDIINNLPEAVYHSEGLSINGHLSAKFILNRHIRQQGFKVALTGEGADELLAGYPHLRKDLFEYSTTQHQAERIHDLLATNSLSAGVQLALGDELSTQSIAKQLGFVPNFLKAKASLGFRMCSVLDDSYKAQLAHRDCYSEMLDSFDRTRQLSGRHPVNQSLYLWTKLPLANYILRTLGDGMEMAHSIEGRVPFLDHHLFEFVRMLPMSFKIKGTIEKYILREAVKSYVTDKIYTKQKHPFMAPPISLFDNKAFRTSLQDILHSTLFASIGFFDRHKISAVINKLPSMSHAERLAWEPIFMMVLTSYFFHQQFIKPQKKVHVS